MLLFKNSFLLYFFKSPHKYLVLVCKKKAQNTIFGELFWNLIKPHTSNNYIQMVVHLLYFYSISIKPTKVSWVLGTQHVRLWKHIFNYIMAIDQNSVICISEDIKSSI